MADEQAQTPVTSQGAEAAPGTADAQNVTAQPPAGEHPVAENTGENRIPKSRFDQVIDQRNRERQLREQYEARIRDLEQARNSPAAKSLVDEESEQLAKDLGLDAKASRRLMEATQKVARAERVQIESQLKQYQLGQWQENMAAKYKDYNTLGPKLAEVWDTLAPHEQQNVLSSPRNLEMYYHYVKSMNLPDMVEQAKSQAAADAYGNKLAKQAVTAVPGAASAKPAGALTRKSIADMTTEEYMKRLPEINAALERGDIK